MSSTNQQGSKTPGQMLKIGSSVIIVPIVVLIFLIKMHLGSGGTDNRSMAPEMVLSRIAPVALYNTGAPLPEPQGAVALTGEQVYNRLCMTCHDTGVTDAPIKGNADQWAPRIAQGAAVLFQHSLEGFNAMPAKGGDASLSDEEVKNAVVFMVNASGGDISVGESGGGDAAAESEEAPTEEAPAEEAITEEAPAPAEEVPAEEAPAEETPVPAEEAPAEEAVEEEVVEETAPSTEEATETEDAAEATEVIEEEAAVEEVEAPVAEEAATTEEDEAPAPVEEATDTPASTSFPDPVEAADEVSAAVEAEAAEVTDTVSEVQETITEEVVSPAVETDSLQSN